MSVTLSQLAETAAFVSARAPFLIESRDGVPEERLQTYWKCCRGRLIDWLRQVDSVAQEADDLPDHEHPRLWKSIEPVLTEIFITDMLTRVFGAVLAATDLHQGRRSLSPIAEHTLRGHSDARTRALALMAGGLRVPSADVARVDRLRRKSEHWSDLLLGHLVLNYQVDEFAIDSRRCVEFGESQVREILRATDEPVWEFVLTGIRLAFTRQGLDDTPPSDAWNQQLVRAVLSSFPADSFGASGTFRSIQSARIERDAESSDRLAESLRRSPLADGQRGVRIRFSTLPGRRKELPPPT